MKNYLFVYGTLRDELAPPEIVGTVRRLKYIGDGFVYGHLYDLGEYPGAILDTSTKSKIFGRIYRLPPDASVLQKLDKYEEFFPHQSSPNLFVRSETVIYFSNERKIRGWIYEYNQDVKSSVLIKSGDYSKVTA